MENIHEDMNRAIRGELHFKSQIQLLLDKHASCDLSIAGLEQILVVLILKLFKPTGNDVTAGFYPLWNHFVQEVTTSTKVGRTSCIPSVSYENADKIYAQKMDAIFQRARTKAQAA